MAHIIQGDPSYTVSLDNIDLDYFYRKIHLPKNGVIKPFWTNVGYKEKDYYEFELIAEGKNDSDSEIYYDHNLICESYVCHICNIHVPKIYTREHNQTTKHKVYLEIADKSLQRCKKHINEEFSYQKSSLRYDCYFCPSCSAAVATELKGDHEKTPGHLISVKHDDLLQEFLKYYLDRDNVKIDFELDKVKVFENLKKINSANANDNEWEKSSPRKEVGQNPNTVLNLNTEDDTFKNSVNEGSNSNVDPIEANTIIIPNNDITTTTSANLSPSGEDNNTLTKNNTVNVEVNHEIDNEATKNNTVNDVEVNHEIDNEATKNNSVNDVEVNHEIDNEATKNNSVNDVEVNHEIDNEATKNNTVNDVEVNHEIDNEATKNNSVNDVEVNHEIDNEANLVDSNDKKTGTDQIELPKKKRKRKKKAKVDNTEVLKEYYKNISLGHKVEVINDESVAITPLKYGEKFLAMSARNNSLNTSIVVPVKNFHAYKQVDGNTRCLLCNINIDDAIESHMFSEGHMLQAMAPIADQNCIRNCHPRYSHCILCNEIIHNVESHLINNSNHNTEIVTFLYQNSSVKTYCGICEIDIGSGNFEAHENSKKHRTNYDKKFPSLRYNSITVKNVEIKRGDDYSLAVTEKPHEMFCKICKVHVPSKNVIQHLNGNTHIQTCNIIIEYNQLQICANGYYCDVCKVNIPMDELVEHTEGEKHVSSLNKRIYSQDDEFHHHIRPLSLSDHHVYCKVCGIAVAKDLLTIDEHLISAVHEDNFTRLIEENKLLKLGERGQHRCLFCDEPLQEEELLEHINSPEHINAIEKSRSETAPSDIKIHPHMQATDNPKELKCKVCLIAVPFLSNNIDEHVIGKNHNKNYSKMLNEFKKVDEMYFCKVCKEFLKEDNVIDHSCEGNNKEATGIGSEVKSNRDSPTSDDRLLCKMCKVLLPNDSNIIEKHNSSEEHLENCSKIMNEDNYFFQLSTDSESVPTNSSAIIRKDSKKTKDENNEVINSEILGNVSETPKSPILHDHMEVTDTPRSLHCRVCKVPVPNYAHCVDIHVNGLKHKNKYETLMRDNKLNERSNCFYCGFCEVLITKNLNIKHVLSETHIMNVSRSTQTQNPSSASVVAHYLMEKVEHTKCLQCKICKVEIVEESLYVKQHLESHSHMELYEEFLMKNCVVLRNDMYSCTACKKLLTKDTEYEHVYNKEHKDNLSSNKYICNICNVAVPNHIKNINEHLRGVMHQSNMSLISDWGN